MNSGGEAKLTRRVAERFACQVGARAVWILVCVAACGCGKTARDGVGIPASGGTAAAGGRPGAEGGDAGAPERSPAQGGDDASNAGAGEISSSQGGDSTASAGAGGDRSSSLTAMKRCKELTTTLCARGLECTTGTTPSICEAQLELEFGCDWAAPADYAACAEGSQSQSCDAVFPAGNLTLPAACLPPITATPLSDAQSKCYALVDTLCVRSIRCLGRVATAASVQDCEDDVTTDLQNGLPCLLAGTVGAGYASCVAAIAGLSCDDASTGGGTPMASIPGCADAIAFTP